MLITSADLPGRGRSDVRIREGRISQLGVDLPRRRGEFTLDACGGALLPGLHDHHVHLFAAAAAAASIPVGPPEVTDTDTLRAVLNRPPGPGGWTRAVGYHDDVAGPLDRDLLDGLVGAVPTRVQHRTGELWILNSAGLRRSGLDDLSDPRVERDDRGRPTGRVWRGDDLLRGRIPPVPLDLTAVSRAGAARGVTGFTDANPRCRREDLERFAESLHGGQLVQRLHAMAPPGIDFPIHPRLTRGPHKIMLDDTALPDLDALVADIAAAHRHDIGVAVHCVTAVQLAVTLAALHGAGHHRADRIEHAAIVPAAALSAVARAGVTLVTQPGMLRSRGDSYLRDLPAEELGDLGRAGSLLAAGIPLAFSSDAPYGPADPWTAIAAAADRTTSAGQPIGPDEALEAAAALRLWQGHAGRPAEPRRIAVGAVADLLLLTAPLVEQLRDPSAVSVHATFVAGRQVHGG